MPRKRATVADDDTLPGLSDLEQDPQPTAAPVRRGPGRPRKATTSTARGPGKIPARTSSGRVMSKAQMESKVYNEVYTYLTLAHAAWELRDPECAGAATPRIGDIAQRVTGMIARNESLLATVAKSGIIGDIIGLLGVLLPIGKAIWMAHGPGGKGHDDMTGHFDEDRYAPYSR